jgi:hypothetical protein
MLDLIASVVAIAHIHGIAETPITDIIHGIAETPITDSVHGYARRDRFQ